MLVSLKPYIFISTTDAIDQKIIDAFDDHQLGLLYLFGLMLKIFEHEQDFFQLVWIQL